MRKSLARSLLLFAMFGLLFGLLLGSVSALYWSPSYTPGSTSSSSSAESSSASPSGVTSKTSKVSERFVKQACKEENGCGISVSKTTKYSPFKRKADPAITKDPELLAINRVKYIYKAEFRKDPEEGYVLKEAKLMVTRGYPDDTRAEQMLRTAYRKNPKLYLKHAKKTAATNRGYAGYKKTWGGSLSIQGPRVRHV